MSRLTHAELAAAQERGDWDLLWRQAIPLVRLVVGRMNRNSEVVDAEEAAQEGMVIAGEAMRSWRPIECAFSTHIGNEVRFGLLHTAGEERNHGVTAYRQDIPVLSLGDARDEGAAPREQSRDDEETSDDGSFDSALTYAGVLRRYTGQLDGNGYVPEGLGDPSEEAERQTRDQEVSDALQKLPPEQQDILRCVYGIGRTPETPEAYAARLGVHMTTAYRRLWAAQDAAQRFLPKSPHK